MEASGNPWDTPPRLEKGLSWLFMDSALWGLVVTREGLQSRAGSFPGALTLPPTRSLTPSPHQHPCLSISLPLPHSTWQTKQRVSEGDLLRAGGLVRFHRVIWAGHSSQMPPLGPPLLLSAWFQRQERNDECQVKVGEREGPGMPGSRWATGRGTAEQDPRRQHLGARSEVFSLRALT